MPTTILDNETYTEALQRRYFEEAKNEENMKLIQMAEEACSPNQTFNSDEEWVKRFAAIVAAHEREKQAEQEPVGEMIDKAGYKGAAWYLEPPATGTPLYTHPVRTKDLTDVDLWKLWEKSDSTVEFARAVIAADREKNK